MEPGRARQTAGDQQQVNSFFSERASYWAGIYQRTDPEGLIHQERFRTRLAWERLVTQSVGRRAL